MAVFILAIFYASSNVGRKIHVALKKPALALKPAVILAENACARIIVALKADANVRLINTA